MEFGEIFGNVVDLQSVRTATRNPLLQFDKNLKQKKIVLNIV